MEHTTNSSNVHGVHTHLTLKYVAIILFLLIIGVSAWYFLSQKQQGKTLLPTNTAAPKEIVIPASLYDTLTIDGIEADVNTVAENIDTVDTLENF